MSRFALLMGLVDRGLSAPAGAPPHRRLSGPAGLDAVLIDRTAEDGTEAMGLALAQVAILSAYAAQGDVLPVALGAAFSGDAAVTTHLAALEPELQARRTALAGRAEWLVAIEKGAAPPPPRLAEGANHLRRRQAEIRARRDTELARHDFITAVMGACGTGQIRVDASPARSPASLAVVAALVHRTAADGLREKLSALAPDGARLGLALRLVGPCAPFSFIGRETADA